MKFVQIGKHHINMDNVTDILVTTTDGGKEELQVNVYYAIYDQEEGFRPDEFTGSEALDLVQWLRQNSERVNRPELQPEWPVTE